MVGLSISDQNRTNIFTPFQPKYITNRAPSANMSFNARGGSDQDDSVNATKQGKNTIKMVLFPYKKIAGGGYPGD